MLFCFFYKHCYRFVFELVFPGFIIRSYLIGFVVSAGPMGPIEVSRWRDFPVDRRAIARDRAQLDGWHTDLLIA